MNKNWIGKAISIQCVELGVFQGTIKFASSETITIVRAFRNGLPLRTLDTEITIKFVLHYILVLVIKSVILGIFPVLYTIGPATF